MRDNPHLYQTLFSQLQEIHKKSLVHLDFGLTESSKLHNIRYDKQSEKISFIDDAQQEQYIRVIASNIISLIFNDQSISDINQKYPSQHMKTLDLFMLYNLICNGEDYQTNEMIRLFFEDGSQLKAKGVSSQQLEENATRVYAELKQKIESKIGPSYQRNINTALSLDEEQKQQQQQQQQQHKPGKLVS